MKPCKHRPPRNTLDQWSAVALTYRKAVKIANYAQSEGFRTMVEGMSDGTYLVWRWVKPASRRAA